MSIRVEPHTLDSLRGQWERFQPSASGRWVFNTPAWLEAWWQGCHVSEEQLVLAACEGGELKGVAPLMRCDDTLRFFAHSDVCDHHDILTAPGHERDVYAALLEDLAKREWSTLDLDGLVDGSGTLTAFPELAQQRGWKVERGEDGVSPFLALPKTFDAYLEGLPKRDRHELRRKIHRLNEAGTVTFRDVENSPNLQRELEVFIGLMKASREDKAQFMTPEREQFFRTLATAMHKAGWLRLSFLDLDGTPVAASLAFDLDNAFHLYNSGFDPKYNSLSVGLVQKALSIKDAIERGRQRYLFLRGPESYKYDLGARDLHLHRLVVTR